MRVKDLKRILNDLNSDGGAALKLAFMTDDGEAIALEVSEHWLGDTPDGWCATLTFKRAQPAAITDDSYVEDE